MHPAVRLRRTSDIVAEAVAASLLLAALAFGGGSRGAGDAVVHLFAIPALVLGVVRWRHADASRAQRFLAWWLLAAGALVALQLLPMPVSLVAYLPQRASVIDDLHRAGLDPQWMTLSLDAWGTVRAGLAFATFAAMTLLATTLSPDARRRLLMLACLAALPMAMLGFAQAAAGTRSTLRPYDYHHAIGAIGLFANRNHFADLMAMLLPFALAFAAQAQQRLQRPLAAAWAALAVLLLLAAGLSFSRAGLALAVLATAATAFALWSRGGQRRHGVLPLLTLAIAALAVAAYAWDGIAARLVQDPLDDLRWQYLRHGRDVLAAYWPAGSGFGTFRDAYAPFEPVARMVNVHALHAHDDLLELLIEGGAPGLALLLGLLGLLAVSFSQIRKVLHTQKVNSRTIHIACTAGCAVPLLHSLVDYPLRTLSIATLFALAGAQLMAATGKGEPATRG